MKTYQGIPPHTVLVLPTKTSSRPLPLCLDVRNHSPTGFSWGYLGSGPAQLALAICVDAVGRDRALQVYQGIKLRLIAKFPGDEPWVLTETEVGAAIAVIERELSGVTR
jgi:hypothetical protein